MVKSLLIRSSLRFMLRHHWQTWLTVLGIMMGVAIVVAVDLANNSARRAFALSLDTVTGTTTHFLQGGPDGIDEQIYVQFRRSLGLQNSAPLISDQVTVNGHAFILLGVDPIAELALQRHTFELSNGITKNFILHANTAVISARAAKKLHLKVNDMLFIEHRSKQHKVKLVGVFTSKNPATTEGLLYTDIGVAQELLGRLGRIDRIDLQLSDLELQTVKAWLPSSLQLHNSAIRNASIRQMSEAFHINLTAMSLLALLVGGLLIYNTMSFSILQRRNSIGVMRALGVTRREIFWLVLTEASLLGLVGTILGLVLGFFLGQGLLQLVMRTVNDLYFVLHVSEFFIMPMSLAKGLLLGLGVTFLAALIPAWGATRNPPVSVRQRSVLEQHWRKRLPLLFIIGMGMLITGWGMVQFSLLQFSVDGLIEGFIALTLIVSGFSLAVPFIMRGLMQGLLFIFAPIMSVTGRMAVRGINASMSRTGMAVAALTVAISMTVGVGIMVSSFRYTVAVWLEQSMNGDIYISIPGRSSARAGPGLSKKLINELQLLPGVAATSASRVIRVETEFGELRLMALDNNEQNARGFNLIQSVDDVRPAFEKGDGVLISEPLAYHQQLNVGSKLQIKTDSGELSLPVLGVFYDYTSSQGMLIVHRALYNRLWQDRKISGVTLFKNSDISQAELLTTVRARVAQEPDNILVRSNREIREVSLNVFDQTFAITHVLRLLAILVAFIAVFSALMSLQLERARELALLRATGMTPKEVASLVIMQTLIMGMVAGFLAMPLGFIMSDILIDVINLRSFGWSMQRIFPVGVLFEALLLALVAALLAGCFPAFKAAVISPAKALREE